MHEEIESVEKRVDELNGIIRSNQNNGKKAGMVNPLKVLVTIFLLNQEFLLKFSM